VDDPSNASPRHLRNRVRHELLPALLAVRPTFADELLALAGQAAGCRAELDALAASLAAECAPPDGRAALGGESVARLAALAGMSPDALAALWPALAARAGARLDRRGTRRLVDHTGGALAAVAAGRRPLSRATVAGGVEVAVEPRGDRRSPEWVMVVRVAAAQHVSRADETGGPVAVRAGPSARPTALGAWHVRVLERAPTGAELEGGAVAWLAAGRRYVVRAWRPGDRWQPAPGAPARRVKRFLADRRVPAPARAGWPVVVVAPVADAGPAARDAAAGEIVWVPGVRRSSAAPARPGQPGFYLLCERTPERRRPPGR
jgi:tRNA(Ile)-lysidine synthase